MSDPAAALSRADIVLAAASTPTARFDLSSIRPDALVCDAGYPKNLRVATHPAGQRVFWGGMGLVRGGFRSAEGNLEKFYRFPLPHVGHGCMLEGMLLALARRYEPFSQGRGRITPDRIEEIWALAARFGFVLAPFFNEGGLWPGERLNQQDRPQTDSPSRAIPA